MAVLMVSQITSAHADVIVTQECTSKQISNNTCDYYDDSVRDGESGRQILSNLTGQECFNSGKSSSSTSDRWDVAGWCVYNGTGYDSTVYATEFCASIGYNILVYDRDTSANTISWGCACARDKNFVEWRTYSTGVMRKYTPSFGANCTITGAVTNEYKCAPGYYGPGNSITGCKVCPANATCSGTSDKNNATRFTCNMGYYNNAANNGCIACPDSKEGGLGWDANGNGIKAYYSGTSIGDCAIQDGTRLYDNTGTFVLDSEDDNEDCFYIK